MGESALTTVGPEISGLVNSSTDAGAEHEVRTETSACRGRLASLGPVNDVGRDSRCGNRDLPITNQDLGDL